MHNSYLILRTMALIFLAIACPQISNAAGFVQDFENTEMPPSGWSKKTGDGKWEIREGYKSAGGAQITGKRVEVSYYSKDNLWTSNDGPGEFSVTFFMKKGVSWRVVLAGPDGRGFVVSIESSKVFVSVGGKNWWEASMQSFAVPDITDKWMTLKLSKIALKKVRSEECDLAKMSLFESDSPSKRYVEDLSVIATCLNSEVPFQRITELKIYEWSSGDEEHYMKIDNIRMGLDNDTLQ